MISWDFSQGGMASPSNSTRTQTSVDDGVFDMDEVQAETRSVDHDKFVTFVPSLLSSLEARADVREVSPLGDSTDEALSTPSTSLPSSNLQHSIHRPSSHTVTLVPARPRAIPPSPSPPLKGVLPSSSPGLWRKLRSIGSKTSMDREKRHEKPKAIGLSPPSAVYKREILECG